jgi:N-acetylglucosamine malate deacetylase 1
LLRHYARRLARTVVQFAFARRQFKLLLRTTLEDIDLRLHAMAAATDLFSTGVQPIVIDAPFGDSMLVVAPHQDDEVIGCGGAMALQRQSGRALNVVVLQDGADEHEQAGMTRDALRERRNAESRAAARIIDADVPTFVGSRDLRADAESISALLRDVIENRRVDALFVPFVLDGHPDHRACNAILARALEGTRRRVRVFQYEVWANCIPNVVVVIDDTIDRKAKMLACFEFANSAVDYAHATMGVNMARSRLLPAGAGRFVEAFFESPLTEYLQLVDAVEGAERSATRSGGSPHTSLDRHS